MRLRLWCGNGLRRTWQSYCLSPSNDELGGASGALSKSRTKHCCWQSRCNPVNTVFASFDIPLSWGELLKRTAKETSDDDCLGLAAQLAYYFFLALFPAILFLIALASFFPLTNFTDDLGTHASTNCSCRCADVFGRPTEAYFGH